MQASPTQHRPFEIPALLFELILLEHPAKDISGGQSMTTSGKADLTMPSPFQRKGTPKAGGTILGKYGCDIVEVELRGG